MSDPVAQRIERARGELENGKLGAAVGSLGDVVYATRDPQLLSEMYALAQEGLGRSSRFGKGEWKRLVKALEKQRSRIEPEREAIAVTK